MFSENGKISQRQLYRMIVVATLGASLLICPRVFGKFGSLGIVAYLLAGMMGALYIWGMLKLRELALGNRESAGNSLTKYESVESRLEEIKQGKLMAGRKASNNSVWIFIKGFFVVVSCIRLIVIAIGGLYIMLDVVKRILLPRTNDLMILLLVGVLLTYWMGSGVESTARAMELLFYWVLVPIVISLAVAIPNVDVRNVVNVVDAGNAVDAANAVNLEKMTDVGNVVNWNMIGDLNNENGGVLHLIITALVVFVIFTPGEIVWLCKDNLQCEKMKKPIWKGFAFFWVANVIAYVIILGIFGVGGLNVDENYPLIKVMQISGVPGDFLRRVDGFMGAFLVVSLFCGVVLALVILKWVVESLPKRGKRC